MTASVSALDAELARLMGESEARSSNASVIVALKPRATPYRIRILPDKTGLQWWQTYGTHYIKNPNYIPGAKDMKKGIMFTCDANMSQTAGTPCAICDAVQKGKKNPDPIYAELAKDSYSGARHLANFVNMEEPTKVQALRLSTTFRNVLFQVARIRSLRFFDINANIVIHLSITGDDNKPEYKLMGVEEPTPSGFTTEHLYDLRAVIADEFGDMASPSQFSGNFYDPISRAGSAIAGPTGAVPMIAAPGAIPMLPTPVAAPVYAPVAPVAAPLVQPMPAQAPLAVVLPTPVAVPVAAPVALQPVYATVAEVPVAAAPVAVAPVTVAPQPVLQPVAAPVLAAPVQAPSMDDLEARLLKMVN